MSWTSYYSRDGDLLFERPLGVTELSFYWDTIFAGVGDALLNIEVEVYNSKGDEIFGIDNVTRAWIHMKHHFPLLGCSVEEKEDSSGAIFILNTARIKQIAPHEITFLNLGSHTEVEQYNEGLVNGPRHLSPSLLSRIYIVRRTDREGVYHVLSHLAHMINDGIANANMLRVLLDILTSSQNPMPSLQDRLPLAVSAEYVYESLHPNIPRKRWRRAIADVLLNIHRSRRRGGHTLPRTVNMKTFYTQPYSKLTTFNFPKQTSEKIIASCRKENITFGHAFSILSQIALARMFHRRRISGEMEESEWHYRIQQPMHFEGPMNMRPRLYPEVFSAEISGLLSPCCSFYGSSVPPMPTVDPISDIYKYDTPPFYSFLSKNRFLHRSRMIKKQYDAFTNHPLLLEMLLLKPRPIAAARKELAMHLRKFRTEGTPFYDSQFPNISGMTDKKCINTNDGSSVGNLDSILPQYYPLHSKSKFVLRATMTTNRFRCRPAELYLGSFMTSQRLVFFIFWDANVYKEVIIDEWLKEVGEATKFYLGEDTHPSLDGEFYEKARL